MLICNLIKYRVDKLLSEQRGGECANKSTLLNLLINQFSNSMCNVNLPCTETIIDCDSYTTTACNIAIVQNLSSDSCDITITQTFNNP